MIDYSTSSVARQHRQLAARFARIRDLLLTNRFEARLNQPLSNWVTPADRRLPRGLLHLRVGELLQYSYASLSKARGIGPVKIEVLLQLLDRAVHTDDLVQTLPGTGGFAEGEVDPTNISEVTWSAWRSTIRRAGLADEMLGRFAATLVELPRALWETKLGAYENLTLADLRSLKTHGRKRIGCILSIYGQLQTCLSERRDPLDLVPQRIVAANRWLRQALAAAELPDLETIERELLTPLVEQIAIDAGEGTAQLVRRRLGWQGRPISIRRAALELRLTRTRIYQLLEDAERIINVRWPQAWERLQTLLGYFVEQQPYSVEHRRFEAAVQTIFASQSRALLKSTPYSHAQERQPICVPLRQLVSTSSAVAI